MNFDWFHATQVEESDNHALFFECKRRHFSIKNTTVTRPRNRHSTGSIVLPLGLAQPKEQPRLLQQLSRFYLLPFLRKKLGYLRTWMSRVYTLLFVLKGVVVIPQPESWKFGDKNGVNMPEFIHCVCICLYLSHFYTPAFKNRIWAWKSAGKVKS